MKKPLLLMLSGAALFGGGYWVRGLNEAEGSGSRKGGGGVAAMVQERAGAGDKGPDKKDGERAGVRPFSPGRPFAKGHAREWILSLVPGLGGDRRANAIAMISNMQVFMTMDADSVREALAAVQELIVLEDAKNPDRRRNPNGDGVFDSLLELTMMRLAQTDPEQALAALKKEYSLNDGSTKMMVFGILTAGDPLRAEQLALSLDKGQQKDALESVMYSLMSKDPLTALAFAERHPEAIGDKHRERIFEGWVRKDPKAAMAAAVQEIQKSHDTDLVRNTIEEWMKTDPAGAAQWAASYEGPGSVVARAMVLERRAKEDPQAALQEYAALQQAGGDPKDLYRITGALADSLARKDVNAAREWAQTLPSSDLRDRALHQVAEEWVKTDAPAASEWIRSLPAGELRDGAARELTSAIARRDPAGAFEWARTIENAKARESALHHVMQNWREADPDAAKAALESLPVEMRPAP